MSPVAVLFFSLALLPFLLKKDWTLGVPVLALGTLIIAAPVLWALVVSLSEFGPYQESPLFRGLANYAGVLKDPGFKLSLKLTACWAFLKASAEILLAFMLALRLRHASGPSKAALTLLTLGWFIPAFITVSGWRAFIQGYGGYSPLNLLFGTGFDLTLNSSQAFVSSLAVSIWLSLPLSTIVIIGMLSRVPRELDDMLKLDGVGDLGSASLLFGEIRYLLIPYGLFQLARAFKEFTGVFLLAGNGPLLAEGFTPPTLVGSTSLVGLVLFRKFNTLKDYGVLSAYAVFLGYFSLLWILGALFSRGEVPRRHRRVLLLSALAHLSLGFFTGWHWTALPLVTAYFLLPWIIPRFRKVFRTLVGFSLLYELLLNAVRFGLEGVSGLLPASFLSVPLIALSLRFKVPRVDFSLPRRLKNVALVGALLPTCLVVCYVLALSFSPDGELFPTFNGGFTLANYARVLSDGLPANVFNTLKIAFWACAVSLSAAVPFGYLFSKKSNLFTRGVTSLILFGGLYTGLHTLLPLYFVFDVLGLADSLFGIALVVSVQTLPLLVLVLGGFFAAFPRELREVSKLDGLSETGFLWRILFPLSLPVLGALATYVLVSSWNAFTLPLVMLEDPALMPFSLKIFAYAGEVRSFYTAWNLFGAASVLGVLPILFFFGTVRKLLYASDLRESSLSYD